MHVIIDAMHNTYTDTQRHTYAHTQTHTHTHRHTHTHTGININPERPRFTCLCREQKREEKKGGGGLGVEKHFSKGKIKMNKTIMKKDTCKRKKNKKIKANKEREREREKNPPLDTRNLSSYTVHLLTRHLYLNQLTNKSCSSVSRGCSKDTLVFLLSSWKASM